MTEPAHPNNADARSDAEAEQRAVAELETNELARLARIEGKLSLPHGYYQSLKAEGSDWEFSIKLVVLLETALGAVIAAKLQNNAMRDHCERLGLAGRAGKIALAEDLGVLQADECKAFGVLADVRNRFAHKIANIRGDLQTFAAALHPGERARICQTAMMIPRERTTYFAFLWNNENMVLLFRHVLWLSGSMLLDALATQDAHAEAEATRRDWMETAHQQFALAQKRMRDSHGTVPLSEFLKWP